MKNFNIIIAGAGGQGLITLLQIIATSALEEGYDVKTSELHGLSQRGGSVETHIRIGKKVNSPLISKGTADLVIGLEMLEALRALPYSFEKTNFVVNKNILPFKGSLSEEEILQIMEKRLKERKFVIPASSISKEKFGIEVVSGTYLFGFAVFNGLIPISSDSALKGIKKAVPKKHFEINKKAFLEAK